MAIQPLVKNLQEKKVPHHLLKESIPLSNSFYHQTALPDFSPNGLKEAMLLAPAPNTSPGETGDGHSLMLQGKDYN